MSDIYEFNIEADGVLTDADGNELDRDGQPVTPTEPAPDEERAVPSDGEESEIR